MALFKQKSKSRADTDESVPVNVPDLRDPDRTKITDAFLDEVDEVLEINAEEFVRTFVQKGGQ
jgi:ubiquitin-like protein Pup